VMVIVAAFVVRVVVTTYEVLFGDGMYNTNAHNVILNHLHCGYALTR
jgi:hypothetical protein